MTFEKFRHHLRNKFLTGLLVILPAFITILMVRFSLGVFQNLFAGPFSFFSKLLGLDEKVTYYLSGILGLFSLFIITYLMGLLVTNVIGRKTIQLGEKLLSKVPLVWNIYHSSKQLMESISVSGKKAFRQVVLVEYPRKGIYTLGFLTSDSRGEVQMVTKKETVNIFVPTTPNPTSGVLIVVPKEDLIPLSMSIEEGIKVVVSGGMVVPPLPEKTQDMVNLEKNLNLPALDAGRDKS
ncbi:MAG: DUF502 domain-containing protein [bacterium]